MAFTRLGVPGATGVPTGDDRGEPTSESDLPPRSESQRVNAFGLTVMVRPGLTLATLLSMATPPLGLTIFQSVGLGMTATAGCVQMALFALLARLLITRALGVPGDSLNEPNADDRPPSPSQSVLAAFALA